MSDSISHPQLDALMASDGIAQLSDVDALNLIGRLIDASHDAKVYAGTTKALDWADELEARGLPPTVLATLDYFRANAWSDKERERQANGEPLWAWELPTLQKEIFYLRRARNSDGFAQLDKIRQCQIHTNLGNHLTAVGRFVEAHEAWNHALAIDPEFWMARGNRGRGFIDYAKALYDSGHVEVFLVFAHRDLAKAAKPNPQHDHLGHSHVRGNFDQGKTWIESKIDVKAAANFKPDDFALGRSASERKYRQWCLWERLFLNPLNDLGSHSIAARDILSLPSFVTSLDEPPVLIGFFNQLKQEFVSARW